MNQLFFFPRFFLALKLVFSFILLFSYSITNGQPATAAELLTTNASLAKKYAPILGQLVNFISPHSADGYADVPVRVDFDGNWEHFDNWDNTESSSPGIGISPSNTNSLPSVYYAVLWTENFWIITYSFYYPRDYAAVNNGCDSDEHLGDLQRVMIVVERANGDVRGMATNHHNSNDIVDCYDNFNHLCNVPANAPYFSGVRPFVYSSPGSHAIYDNYNDAFVDPAFESTGQIGNICTPFVGGDYAYMPGSPPVHAPYDPAFPSICGVVPRGIYQLIDIFDESIGLWAQRENALLFSQETNPSEQHFACTEGNCDHTPSSPWNGGYGLNPVGFVAENFGTFECDCVTDPTVSCDEIEFTDCLFDFNPYLCEFYDIVMPETFSYNGNTVPNPFDNGDDLVLNLNFSAIGIHANPQSTAILWEFTPSVGVHCTGCNSLPTVPPSNSIVLVYENTNSSDILENPQAYTVTVSTSFIECGPIEKETSLADLINGFVTTDGNCTKMVFEVPDDHHIDGSQYDWDFPLYNSLATTSTNGRRVEFNTQTVLQQTSTITNPNKELAYTLTISNTSFPTEVEVTGKQQIPACTYGGGLGLKLYPNPAQSDVYLDLEGTGLKDDFVIHVYDHQFKLISSGTYSVESPSVDVSGLNNGLYFICLTTKQGKMLSDKFCIDRH